mgnify:CR=1 FL=1
MVKGVNKTIIEINNTESEYFDRILLFVKASYSGDAGNLDRELAKISRTLSSQTLRIPLRQSEQNRKKKLLFFAAGAVAFVALVVAGIILF